MIDDGMKNKFGYEQWRKKKKKIGSKCRLASGFAFWTVGAVATITSIFLRCR